MVTAINCWCGKGTFASEDMELKLNEQEMQDSRPKVLEVFFLA